MSLDTDIGASEDLLGKVVSDLQSNIAIANNAITGTLNYVTGYTGFSGDSDLQSGNYIALHVSDVPADATVKVELIGGDYGEVTLDADRIVILRIKNTTQKVKVEVIKGTDVITEIYSLTGLTLTPEGD